MRRDATLRGQLSDNRMDTPFRSIDWVAGTVVMIDQTLLPDREVWLEISEVAELVAAIKRLAVRGAPSLGVAGALGVVLAAAHHDPGTDPGRFAAAVQTLRTARPTAVNLSHSVDRVAARSGEGSEAMLKEALIVRDEEIAACHAMAVRGADLLVELCGDRPLQVMTVCNTGALAAVEKGTALGVIDTLHERGRLSEALVLETRPLLQGARLTTWELARVGAQHRLVVDSAGPFLMSRGEVDAVVIGADRVAANGDTANKIGSFALALGARHAGIPFVVVAPESTIDMATPSGTMIEIEDRGPDEVTAFAGTRTAPPDTRATNPAFDLTPAALVDVIVTNRRVVRHDRGQTLDSELPGPPGRSNENR
jgi:methylthioribose-1-phosphate isomerase